MIAGLLLAAALAAPPAAAPASPTAPPPGPRRVLNRVAGLVNGEVITLQEVEDRAGPELRILIPYAIFLLFLWTRARRLKRRVAEIVDVAAHRLGLQRITKKRTGDGPR